MKNHCKKRFVFSVSNKSMENSGGHVVGAIQGSFAKWSIGDSLFKVVEEVVKIKRFKKFNTQRARFVGSEPLSPLLWLKRQT